MTKKNHDVIVKQSLVSKECIYDIDLTECYLILTSFLENKNQNLY